MLSVNKVTSGVAVRCSVDKPMIVPIMLDDFLYKASSSQGNQSQSKTRQVKTREKARQDETRPQNNHRTIIRQNETRKRGQVGNDNQAKQGKVR